MKRSALKPGKQLERKTPLRSTSTLKASKPMARGATRMRAKKPKSPKMAARNAGPDWLAMCRGQPCYLRIPGICTNDRETVVPAHSNQNRHGKSMGMKALDIFTIPACHACHSCIDQGAQFTKAEKFALWDAAYELWSHDRKIQFESNDQQHSDKHNVDVE